MPEWRRTRTHLSLCTRSPILACLCTIGAEALFKEGLRLVGLHGRLGSLRLVVRAHAKERRNTGNPTLHPCWTNRNTGFLARSVAGKYEPSSRPVPRETPDPEAALGDHSYRDPSAQTLHRGACTCSSGFPLDVSDGDRARARRFAPMRVHSGLPQARSWATSPSEDTTATHTHTHTPQAAPADEPRAPWACAIHRHRIPVRCATAVALHLTWRCNA